MWDALFLGLALVVRALHSVNCAISRRKKIVHRGKKTNGRDFHLFFFCDVHVDAAKKNFSAIFSSGLEN
jgi:hypothetical protein